MLRNVLGSRVVEIAHVLSSRAIKNMTCINDIVDFRLLVSHARACAEFLPKAQPSLAPFRISRASLKKMMVGVVNKMPSTADVKKPGRG